MGLGFAVASPCGLRGTGGLPACSKYDYAQLRVQKPRSASALFMTQSSGPTKAAPAAPSWQDLALKIPNDFLNPDYVNGVAKVTPPWDRDCVRLFGQTEEDIQFVFYRDTSYWCPYCQRVQIYLEEKKVPYRFKKVNLKCYGRQPGWYLKINGSGSLPLLEIGRRYKLESLQIMLKLEKEFPDTNPLLPKDGEGKRTVERHLGIEKKLTQRWLRCLRAPDTQQEKVTAELYSTLEEVEALLEEFDGPYFMGESVSITDFMYAPFVERQLASLLYWRGIDLFADGAHPNLNKFMQAMRTRHSYSALTSDTYSLVRNLPPQIGPCKKAVGAESIREQIENGPLMAKLSSDDSTLGARYSAAAQFINHHEVVVRDALRGLGERENQELHDQIDLAFRFAIKTLIDGSGEVDLRDVVSKKVVDAAKYERKRVCIPRDLSPEAAVQFQGAMNWLIGCIE
uniref:GST N-terminal domain-containing protein n=2 Tax=Rhodosorus marinus TaxID=101924 RepID=A0A7S3EFU9_9RHOD|mmetsp:Transcript_32711/g.128537  ORF Transcript_32711/g.128537 Transcript_32711/m.128537 type:complete len:454 (+) Transcript_32711:320-1681(+)|eukprot:CAMPEP_0113956248 /NCGR_PEP_ID=MMETSP0011_2-20120614/1934_1 /TAXON_ID=101924 /ORGANISM="Rhodosorus marinus" /LENGTH=453 /DNA_ID=CAMNT_0000966329 /DNA_START=181 /DNA_END=1542 /DNA_ORIENTATION=- /assembly_acc=CAM_ASM_000156